MKKCAHCGEKVYAAQGFFRSWPDPVALHHHCHKHYNEARRAGEDAALKGDGHWDGEEWVERTLGVC